MRIRKHASKILGIASSLPSSSPPPSQLPPAYVCELNRSPWDLVPLPPLPHSDEYWSPDPKEQDEGLLGNGIKGGGEEAMCVTASSTEFMRNEQVQEEEEEKNMSVKKGKKRNKKKMKKEVGIEANNANAATTTVSTCKKTDGKQWQCKRPAHQPHTFCHYHLTQLRSYSYSSGHNKISSAGNRATSRRKRAVMDTVGYDSNYVYYSTFGPWRAKRRGGDSSATSVAAKHEQVGEEEEEKGGSSAAPMIHDDQKNIDKEEDGVEDSEGQKKMEMEMEEMDKRDPRRNMLKKRRKPVKERSLKSLL